MANRELNVKDQEFVTQTSKRTVLYPALMTALVGVCIGLLAPFGMHQIPVYVSITYWVTTCLVGYVVYQPVISLLDKRLTPLFSKRWPRVAVGTCIASVLMSLVVPIITWLFFKEPFALVSQFIFTFPKCLLIGGIITAIEMVREHMAVQKLRLMESKKELEQSQLKTQGGHNKAYQAFMKEIPVEKRGNLLCLEMSDHYVKVHTDTGHHMLLMRFKDAIQSLESYPGLQTHRSWWVANDAIKKVQKQPRKIQLVLTNDLVIPVSRTYQTNVVKAGFAV